MMTCKEICDFIAAFLDEDLPDEQRAIFEKHLSMCPPCKDYIDGYRRTIECGKGACEKETEQVCKEVPEALVEAILKARKQ